MEGSTKTVRKIIHVDMDAFYASVEQRDFPHLRGKPLVVGGSPEGRGGVVATASYEARAYGIRSAMSSKKAQQLCPYAIFVYPRFQVYKEVSKQIHEIFARYTDLIEPLSLDEAYLDVTFDKKGIGSAIDIAKEIKAAIKEELGLTASAGVSINKFVAKVASDLNKPDGLTFVGPSKIARFMEKLPVEKFHGVGKVTAQRMKMQGIRWGSDLKKLSEERLTILFGKSGKFFYQIVRGIDNREVKPHRETKSISSEDTFAEDMAKDELLEQKLLEITRNTFARAERYQLFGRTLNLKVKFSDFKVITRSKSFDFLVVDVLFAYENLREMLEQIDFEHKKVRLIGVGLSNFLYQTDNESAIKQTTLFKD